MLNVIVGLCAMAAAVICTLLVFHPDYEDGLIGRLALSGMALAAVARVCDLVAYNGGTSQIGSLLWMALAVFLSRHFWRFLRWRNSGAFDWRKADVLSSGGKVKGL